MNPETLVGMKLGEGVLERLVGQGTMGAVFLAEPDEQKQRQVAIKVFLPASSLQQAEHEEFLRRLKQELVQNTSLKHAYILPVLAHGMYEGLLYQVTPYIDGACLRSEIERTGPLPFADIQRYLEQLASALDYAHGCGVLHRDIKPENILLSKEGYLLLTDFGLAGVTTEKNFALTRRAVPGLLNYMAPEYALGKAIDQRADLYSLGAVLYQMVTGKTLFKGASLGEIAVQHVKAVPTSPRSLRTDLHQAAEQVILRALATRPADRYAKAHD